MELPQVENKKVIDFLDIANLVSELNPQWDQGAIWDDTCPEQGNDSYFDHEVTLVPEQWGDPPQFEEMSEIRLALNSFLLNNYNLEDGERILFWMSW